MVSNLPPGSGAGPESSSCGGSEGQQSQQSGVPGCSGAALDTEAGPCGGGVVVSSCESSSPPKTRPDWNR